MRYHVLACDYDGTIAHHGEVTPETLAALQAVKETGRRIMLVTGRELDDLQRVFPGLDLFDAVVAENGALLYLPATNENRALAEPPPERFVRALEERGVQPLSVGRSIVATWSPHESAVLGVIREQGLELQVIFNKGAVMVLPAGVNKASGFKAALAQMKLSPHNAVGVGDAENDHAFLAICECSAAVANALPALKERSDLVMERDHGDGVIELIERLVRNDLADAYVARHEIPLGRDAAGNELRLGAHAGTVMVAGTSGGGKSTFTTGVLERLAERGYQMCIIDPEGDYEHFEQAVVLGTSDNSPTVAEALEVLDDPHDNAVVNLLALKVDERPQFVAELLPQLLRLRSAAGRPHWIVMDETHHLFPRDWSPSGTFLPGDLPGMVLITVHPDHVASALLASVEKLIAIGSDPGGTLAKFCTATGHDAPATDGGGLETGEALLWEVGSGSAPVRFASVPPRTQLRRHLRKYAEGKLGEDRSFYFRGPDNRLRLRAYNLGSFIDIGDGLDDETWDHHLRRGDYSRWIAAAIKDRELAEEVAEVEKSDLGAADTRDRIRQAIAKRYTLPA